MRRLMLTAIALAVPVLAGAKLPAPDDATKAKAAEAAAKAAWQGKVDAYALCKVQDKIAASYKKGDSAAAAKPASSAASGAAMPATAAASGAAKPVVAVQAAKPAASAASSPSTSQGGATPVPDIGTAQVTLPPCADPGPFAYNQPSQTPLETSGAHSPAGNATQPPSVRPDSAQMAPAKK